MGLPQGITATLFETELIVTASANNSAVRSGTLYFTFGTLTAELQIEQGIYQVPDRLEVSVYELPPFLSDANLEADFIQVTSSSAWQAKVITYLN